MIRKIQIGLSFVLGLGLALPLSYAQSIPSMNVLPINELSKHLAPEVVTSISGSHTPSHQALAAYFRNCFQQRFFYNWQTADERFAEYNHGYHNETNHRSRAHEHLAKFPDSTQWLLPFNDLKGAPVDAYALRHLARQHKMVDIAYLYFYEGKDPKYIQYFTAQMHSLNAALEAGEYEKIKDGNGVYEVYRSGYRILNWLSIHNLFLGESSYTDEDQLYTIATLLQHAAHLYEHNESFHSGNHQTRGMSALAMLSILFRDFNDADLWYKRSMRILGEHLSNEINEDGFQFERSVHYHMSDIANYFYVYQLAKLSNMEVDEQWEQGLKALFSTLAKIAYPDKSAPVLQDDTDNPWAEKNTISGTMTLGYLLFDDPEMGYFADDKVEDRMYWFLPQEQLKRLSNIQVEKPNLGSLQFPQTAYYIMREGWNTTDKMMVVSAGLDDKKPDHQHGDMLGIQAMANNKVILPNYQVRYSLKDYEWFKNSMVKNVALVDNQLQGKQWSGNKGGSGFGKFKLLPHPTTLAWQSNAQFDLFIGTHDGFEQDGVKYTRQVVYVKDDFWIVKDNFYSTGQHTYKQVWQGHYTTAYAPKLLRSTFDNGSGFDILQLTKADHIKQYGKQGKEWTVVEQDTIGDYSFVSILFPYSSFENRINEEKNFELHGWAIKQRYDGTNEAYSISKDGIHYILGIRHMEKEGFEISFESQSDIILQDQDGALSISNFGDKPTTLLVKYPSKESVRRSVIQPGETLRL